MKNRTNIICLSCGRVHVRTNVFQEIKNKYVVLNKTECPICSKKTTQVATKNIKVLKKSLEADHSKQLDEHLYYLINR